MFVMTCMMAMNLVDSRIVLGGESVALLLLVYMALGYWAAGLTVYRNYIMIGTMHSIFMRKLITGTFLGWLLIPMALIRIIFRI